MGEMADWILEQDDPFITTTTRKKSKELKCMYCKTKKLHWGVHKKGWRLFTRSGKLHVCGMDDMKE